jgi:hypothetical protein
MNVFSKDVAGLEWLGKEIVQVGAMLPRVVTVVDDVDGDAQTVLPELVTVVDDVDALAVAAVKDGGACLSAAETLTAAIMAEAEDAETSNIPAAIAGAPGVVAAFEAFVTEVTTKGTWADVLSAQSKLVTDYDKLGTTVKAAIVKLEQDA